MAAEAPKYVRKKCEHGKQKYYCMDCGGGGICEHKRHRSHCKECKGSGICEHQRTKNNCKDCNGAGICEHSKRRTRCVECKGGSICPHNKLKSRCEECDGHEICEHHIRREYCVECTGQMTCEHGKRRSRCTECGGNEICPHLRNKYWCTECTDSGHVCEHGRLRVRCVECKGAHICIHERRKDICTTCNPSLGCENCKSIFVPKTYRFYPHCFRCYCVLHPDAEIPRMFKLKEHYVRDRLKERFQDTITMVFDRRIEDGCSRHRPDVYMDFGSHTVIIEVDENRHASYECEMKRMVTLYEDTGCRRIVFLRFNPDGYEEGSHRYPSPFRHDETGLLQIDEVEMERRITLLVERIQWYAAIDETMDDPVTREYLFYGDAGFKLLSADDAGDLKGSVT